MPNTNTATGKAGTIKPEEFEQLERLYSQYGGTLLAQKVSKICSKMSSGYLHEFPSSAVGAAWRGLAAKIDTSVGTGTRPISIAGFSFLKGLVANYGAEVIMQKIAKLASRASSADATRLKAVFPKATTRSTAA